MPADKKQFVCLKVCFRVCFQVAATAAAEPRRVSESLFFDKGQRIKLEFFSIFFFYFNESAASLQATGRVDLATC